MTGLPDMEIRGPVIRIKEIGLLNLICTIVVVETFSGPQKRGGQSLSRGGFSPLSTSFEPSWECVIFSDSLADPIHFGTIHILYRLTIRPKANKLSAVSIKGDQRFPADLLWAMIRVACKCKDMTLHRPADFDLELRDVTKALYEPVRSEVHRHVAAMVRAEPVEWVEVRKCARMLISEDRNAQLIAFDRRIVGRTHPLDEVDREDGRLVWALGQIGDWVWN